MSGDKLSNRIYVDKWLKRNSNPYGIVYMITNVVTGDTYIGSTTSPIKKRWWQIVAAANAGRGGKLNDNIRLHGKECFDIELLYECSADEDLKEKENEYIRKHNPSLNKNIAKCNENIFKDSGNFY